MKTYTARELIDEIRRQADILPSGLNCKIFVGDIEGNHSNARHMRIQSNARMNAIEILCDSDEVLNMMPEQFKGKDDVVSAE